MPSFLSFGKDEVSPIRILHLDDNPTDHFLVKREITIRHLEASFVFVTNKQSYSAALELKDFDIILSDYRMPAYDGDQSLALACEVCPEIPFIMVTGELGEDRAIEMLKQGAWDYILKGNLKRLVPAIERALAEAQLRRERREAADELRISEERLRRAMAIETVGTIFFKIDGSVTEANEAFLRMSGYSREDVKNGIVRWDVQTPKEYMPQSLNAVREFITFGHTNPYEKEYIRKDGSRWWGLFAASRISDDEGVEFIIDITEQKREAERLKRAQADAEESHRLLNALMENINEGIAITGGPPDFPIRAVSRHSIELSGKPTGQLTNIPAGGHHMAWDLLLPDGATRPRQEQMPLYRAARLGEVVENEEFNVRRADGTLVPVLVNAAPVRDASGSIVAAVNTFRDVTEEKNTRRSLEEGREHYQALFDKSPLPKWIVNLDTFAFMGANEACTRLYGYTNQEFLGMTLADIRTPEEFAKFVQWVERTKGLFEGRSETKHRTKDGRVIDADVYYREIQFFGQRAAVSVTIDVTEAKRAQGELRDLYALANRRAAELRTVIESMPDAVYIGTSEGITLANANALRMLGARSLEDLRARIGELGKKFAVRWPDTGRPLREDELQFTRALRGETAIDEVLATNALTGEDIHIRSACAPIYENGTVVAAVAINSDISARKRAEEALQRSEEKFAKVFHGNTSIMIISRLRDGLFIDVNDQFLETMNWTREEVVGQRAMDLSIWKYPEQLEHFVRTLGQDGMVRQQEYIFTNKIGQEWIGLTSAQLITLEDEQVIVSSIIDVTERKEAERRLFYQAKLLSNVFDAVIATDSLSKITYWNKSAEELFGWTASEVSGKTIAEIFQPKFTDGYREDVVARLARDGKYEGEVECRRSDGTHFAASIRSVGLQTEGGNLEGTITSVREVSGRKRTEGAFRSVSCTGETSETAERQPGDGSGAN